MRRPLLLVLVLSLLAAPGGAAAGTPPRPVPLTVLSFNMHTGIGADGVLDLDRTVEVIRRSGADVVGLQEVDVHWADRSEFRDQARALARALRMRVFFAPIYDLPPATEGAPRRRYGPAVLSRYPVVRAENHELTRMSSQDGSTVPMPGFAEAVVLVRGVPVHVYCTHLDYRPDPAVRAVQVAETLEILAADRPGANQVLLGDLNAEPAAPELAPLWTVLEDTGDGRPSFPADAPVKRLDYVAVSPNVRATRTEVIDSTASDHRPVLAELLVGQSS
jgi:endonuclease/exonuclease/phosphatase family metal-dependent hydrolase